MTGEQQDGCVCVSVCSCLYKASAHWQISGSICIIKNRNIISTLEQQQQLDIVPTLNTLTILQECTFLVNFTDNKRIKKNPIETYLMCWRSQNGIFESFDHEYLFMQGIFFFLVISKFNRSILKISGFFGSQNKTIPSNCTQTHSEDTVIGFLCSCVIHSQSNFKAPAAAIDSWGHLYSLLALCPLLLPFLFLSSLSPPFSIFPFSKYVGT